MYGESVAGGNPNPTQTKQAGTITRWGGGGRDPGVSLEKDHSCNNTAKGPAIVWLGGDEKNLSDECIVPRLLTCALQFVS